MRSWYNLSALGVEFRISISEQYADFSFRGVDSPVFPALSLSHSGEKPIQAHFDGCEPGLQRTTHCRYSQTGTLFNMISDGEPVSLTVSSAGWKATLNLVRR
jgi:hypothetical protein